MTASDGASRPYLFGQSEQETQRLVDQARLYDRPTRRLFEDAGLGPGMRVLDLGSGAGDVAFLAADLVGPAGAVVGVDHNPAIVETARRRAQEAGLRHVAFLAGDLREELALDGTFDALVGRFILSHLADPAAALRRLLPRLRPGGIVAFQEILQQGSYAADRPLPAWERLGNWVLATIARSGGNPAGGMALHPIFLAAGLPTPELRAHAAVITGPDSPHLGLLLEGFRSVLPRALDLGVATAEEVDVDTLDQRIRAEFAAAQAVALGRLAVDAWARTPETPA